MANAVPSFHSHSAGVIEPRQAGRLVLCRHTCLLKSLLCIHVDTSSLENSMRRNFTKPNINFLDYLLDIASIYY